MKKSFFFGLALVCCLVSTAQNSWGLLSSLNFDKISGDGMSNKFGTGYNAGAYAQIQIIKKLSIQPQFLFSQRNVNASSGFKSTFPESASSNFKTAISTNYISMPLLLNYKFTNSFSLNLGPQFSYVLDTDEKLLAGNYLAFKGRDLSLIGGVELKLSSFKLFSQYNYGLYNLNKIDNGQRQWQSRGFQFGIGWKISR